MKWLQATARNIFHGLNGSKDGVNTIVQVVLMCGLDEYGVMGKRTVFETVRICMTIEQAESLQNALQEWIRDAKQEHEKIEVCE